MSSKSVGLFFLVLILTAGCATQSPYTATGAAIGGGLGAITGAAID
ncbi:MAG: OmpA family protein, partial [Deltaproteobacteria bacterium]|nr:OmpA family protein [Deltaproteobacteria bacterium]